MEEKKFLDKSVTFSIKHLLQVTLIVLLALVSFSAGRYVFPAGGEGVSIGFGSSSPELISGNAVNEAVTGTELVSEIETSNNEDTQQIEIESQGSETQTDNGTEDLEQSDDAQGDGEETIITDYRNIVVSFSKEPTYEWPKAPGMGLIDLLHYKIINNADGGIEPRYFKVIIDDKNSKEVNVPTEHRLVHMNEQVEGSFGLGSSYTSKQNDPSSIKITLKLLDMDKKLIASTSRVFDLS